MKEYPLVEFGYFTEEQCRVLAKALNGGTYMHFEVSYSNYAGNCTLIVKTNYDTEREKIVGLFMQYLISRYSDTLRALEKMV